MLEAVKILGVTVHNVTMEEALHCIDEFVASQKSHLVVTLGTEMVMSAQDNTEFRDIVNSSPLVLPDGGGLLWASRRLGQPLKEKVAGIDFLTKICENSIDKKWKIFFLGGKPGIVEKATKNLQSKIPNFQPIGVHHGYLKAEEIIPILRRDKPDILFVGLGSPKQEEWLSKNLERLGIPVGIGVGGSFDVLAGKLKRAPAWMIDLNLEWLFRVFQEPQRFLRILKIPIFMMYVGFEAVFKKTAKRWNS